MRNDHPDYLGLILLLGLAVTAIVLGILVLFINPDDPDTSIIEAVTQE